MPDRDQFLNSLVESYAGLEGRDLIRAAVKGHEGRVALLSSFGAESSVLLHMVSELEPSLPIIFLDTEKLFPETAAYRLQLTRELGLRNVMHVKPDPEDIARIDPGGVLHTIDKDLCCHFRKTVPMQKAFAEFDIIISGRKRFHGAARSTLDFVSVQDGKIKLEPLAAYSALDLHNYMVTHHLPSHPLRLAGYRSIGCEPCTVPGGDDYNPRAGRWSGSDKTECGIHFSTNGKVIRIDHRAAAGV